MKSLSEHISEPSEYAIYTYDLYDRDQFGINKWQKYKSLQSFDRALNEAKVLFRSNRFQRIEIKQKYHDRKLQRRVSKTLKSFDRSRPSNHDIYFVSLGLGFLLLALFATIKF